jgi:hypothetical protein
MQKITDWGAANVDAVAEKAKMARKFVKWTMLEVWSAGCFEKGCERPAEGSNVMPIIYKVAQTTDLVRIAELHITLQNVKISDRHVQHL